MPKDVLTLLPNVFSTANGYPIDISGSTDWTALDMANAGWTNLVDWQRALNNNRPSFTIDGEPYQKIGKAYDPQGYPYTIGRGIDNRYHIYTDIVNPLQDVYVTASPGKSMQDENGNFINTSRDDYGQLVGDKLGNGINKLILGTMGAAASLPALAADPIGVLLSLTGDVAFDLVTRPFNGKTFTLTLIDKGVPEEIAPLLNPGGYTPAILFKYPYLFDTAKAFIEHPTWLTVYHGSPKEFPIDLARMGTSNDMGLHVGTKDAAATKVAGGTTYKLRVPKMDALTIDLWSNGASHLEPDYVFARSLNAGSERAWADLGGIQSGQSINMKDPIIKHELQNLGLVEGVDYRIVPANDGVHGYLLMRNSDLHVHPRSYLKKAIPKDKHLDFDDDASSINYELYSLNRKFNKAQREALKNHDYERLKKLSADKDLELSLLNADAAALLDKYGIRTVGYYNGSQFEATDMSYWINNPRYLREIKQVTPNNNYFAVPSATLSYYLNLFNNQQ